MMLSKPCTNSSFVQLLSSLGKFDLMEGPFVAGGAARRLWFGDNWPDGDVDVFFVNNLQRQQWQHQLEKRLPNHSVESSFFGLFGMHRKPNLYKAMETTNADTYHVQWQDNTIKLQLIKTRYSSSVNELWQNFDFAASCFATDGQQLVASLTAVTSCENRQLIVNQVQQNKNLPLRVLKYHIYGFEANNELLMQAADAIVNGELDWNSDY